MKKWKDKADKVFADTKSAVQTLWDNINKGQKKQLEKIPEVKEILERYGITNED